MTMLNEVVELATRRAGRYGVLDVALDLPAGWEDGITFRGTGCNEPDIVGPCVVTDTTEIRPGDPAVFEPVFIRQSAACATIGRVGTTDIAADRLDSTSEWTLGRALATGIGSTNPALTDAELVLASAATNGLDGIIGAVSCLEQAAADVGFGAEVFLHAPAKAAALLKYARLIEDGLSPMGHPWIISPGYPGGVDAGDSTTVTIWATGTVWAAVGDTYPMNDPVDGRSPVGWRTNLDLAFAQRIGLAAFDPCLNLSATFTVPACIGGS